MKRYVFVVLLAIALRVALCLAQPEPISPFAVIEGSAQEFVGFLSAGEFGKAFEQFADVMKAAIPEPKLKAVWQDVTSSAGPFKGQLGVRTEEKAPFRMVFVTCEFEKGPLDIRLVYNQADQVTGLWFGPSLPPFKHEPPEYARPDSFREDEVTVGEGQWALPGTLTLPRGGGPFPAVVLVHGSGPQDRDETVLANKPFRDLAWGLASRGIAVLRYDKRTKVHGAKMASAGTPVTVKEETIDDALAAVALLRRADRIEAGRIFVLGHSLGGMLVPRIGLRDSGVAGFIVMAGTTRPFEDVFLEQLSYIVSLTGPLSEDRQATLAEVEKQAAAIKELGRTGGAAGEGLLLGAPPEYWLDLKDYDPPEVARKLLRPMLILQGGRDYQVTLADFQGWKDALSSRQNVELKLYPRLNHLFVEGEGKSTPAEYRQPGHVAKAVIDDIAEWIRRH